MSVPILFLLGGVGLAAILGVLVWLVSRPRKQKFGSTIDSFSSDLSALAPPPKASNQSPRRNPGPRARAAGSGGERQTSDTVGRNIGGRNGGNAQTATSRSKFGPQPRSS